MTCRKIGPCCKGDKDRDCREDGCMYYGRIREEVGGVSRYVAATTEEGKKVILRGSLRW